ncbi:MAG: hypothetical protein LBO05_08185 [Deltaproteobacteria bacterium]|jgi:hypothetical protein|nr:hypothetical protein [Deltaproteobacteria bacterium]
MDQTLFETLVEKKLANLLADEKLRAAQDPVYLMLADMTSMLREAYKRIGAPRPLAQIQSETLDIMVECFSSEQTDTGDDFFIWRLKQELKKYRPVESLSEVMIREIIAERRLAASQAAPAQRAEAAFEAFLGSVRQTEAMWLGDNKKRAGTLVEEDLRLDELIERENITVSAEETEEACRALAEKCRISVEEVRAGVDAPGLEAHLKRQKARLFQEKTNPGQEFDGTAAAN